MAEDFRTRAAAAVDADFRQARDDLIREHQRQEQRELAQRKAQMAGFVRNREEAEQRYVARLNRIDRGYHRAAAAIDRRHNSLAGRMERLTKAGRDRQEATRQALEDRRAKLDRQASRNFEGVKERQFQAEQRERIHHARVMKMFRLDHLEHRQTQRDHHERTRDIKIDVRVQRLKDAAELSLRQQLRQLQPEQAHKLSR